MTKTESKSSSSSIRSIRDVTAFVNRIGLCYLFKKKGHPRIWDMVKEADSTTRRGMVLGWSEQAHLRRRIFLFVDGTGSPLAVSWKKFRELFEANTRMELSDDEKRLVKALRQPMTTPELRKAIDIPTRRFDKALIGVRSKMRVALVDVIRESKTKHVNCYDRIEKWLARRT